ncbi:MULTISPECIES: hypothetical protein [unclassified Sphingomonas]|uniref:hypothetical protein n=1 Tax=unclassified Sphingomonas TaxID=196159 RepID=UPI000701E0D7|nr:MULTISPECIES: hypothetical protein [unclassified Sphingomonas]KQM24891.1 hypothetical protein ASE58_16020 [Sphingomonas sp. Leaf9]KQM42549.1 hypothetical protein ASE57_16020 [Sphingomonas sp. Leaf11]
MKILAYLLLAAAMVGGFVGPIVTGAYVAGAVGGAAQLFPANVCAWPMVFGVLAAIGALTPPVIAERNGWLAW